MRALLALISALSVLGATARAQPAVGDAAPEIDVETVFGTDGPVTLEGLRGRAVVLELWATWCSPCIPALDHLASVAEEVRGEPVAFLAVTDEPAATVQRFLDRRPTTLPLAADTDSSVFRAYRPGARPQTILIGPDGRIAARTMPRQVTPDVLRRLVAGEPLGDLEPAPALPPDRPGEAGGGVAYDVITRGELDRLDEGTVYKAILRPFLGRGGGGISVYDRPERPFAYRRVTSRATPTALLLWASDAFALHVDDAAGLPQEPWFADVIVPEGEADPTMAAVKAEAVRLVERTFGVTVTRGRRPTDVYRLQRLEGVPSGFTPARARGEIQMQGARVAATGRPFSEFLNYLAWQLDRPLVGETGLDQGAFVLYDFGMEVVLGAEGDLERALRGAGLRLVEQDGWPMDALRIAPRGR